MTHLAPKVLLLLALFGFLIPAFVFHSKFVNLTHAPLKIIARRNEATSYVLNIHKRMSDFYEITFERCAFSALRFLYLYKKGKIPACHVKTLKCSLTFGFSKNVSVEGAKKKKK